MSDRLEYGYQQGEHGNRRDEGQSDPGVHFERHFHLPRLYFEFAEKIRDDDMHHQMLLI